MKKCKAAFTWNVRLMLLLLSASAVFHLPLLLHEHNPSSPANNYSLRLPGIAGQGTQAPSFPFTAL